MELNLAALYCFDSEIFVKSGNVLMILMTIFQITWIFSLQSSLS